MPQLSSPPLLLFLERVWPNQAANQWTRTTIQSTSSFSSLLLPALQRRRKRATTASVGAIFGPHKDKRGGERFFLRYLCRGGFFVSVHIARFLCFVFWRAVLLHFLVCSRRLSPSHPLPSHMVCATTIFAQFTRALSHSKCKHNDHG